MDFVEEISVLEWAGAKRRHAYWFNRWETWMSYLPPCAKGHIPDGTWRGEQMLRIEEGVQSGIRMIARELNSHFIIEESKRKRPIFNLCKPHKHTLQTFTLLEFYQLHYLLWSFMVESVSVQLGYNSWNRTDDLQSSEKPEGNNGAPRERGAQSATALAVKQALGWVTCQHNYDAYTPCKVWSLVLEVWPLSSRWLATIWQAIQLFSKVLSVKSNQSDTVT